MGIDYWKRSFKRSRDSGPISYENYRENKVCSVEMENETVPKIS